MSENENTTKVFTESVFENHDSKLKSAAKIILWLNIFISIIILIAGIKLCFENSSFIILLISISGAIVSLIWGYFLSLLIYSFGDLCENISLIRSNIYPITTIMEKKYPDLVEFEDEDLEEEINEDQ
ncbi:MAG: hypothetical protein GXY08_06455 [Ruminococcus sp.]|nr:hypothetical protein [Ruminococcus sp.]